MSLCVFPDTGVLLAMLVFPEDRAGVPTLAGEVLSLAETGASEICRRCLGIALGL